MNLNLAELILGLTVFQQSLAGLIWWVALRVGAVPSDVGRHWLLASLWAAACLAQMMLLPGEILSHTVPNALLVLAFIWAGRGLEALFERPPRTPEAVAVTLLSGLCGALGWWAGWGGAWTVFYASLLNAYCLLRTAQICAGPARRELGKMALQLVQFPIWFLALVFVLRALTALLWPDQMSQGLRQASAVNLAGMALLLPMGLLLHLALGLTVAMRMVLSLQRSNRRDPLTGLANRRVLDEQAPALMALLARHGTPFAVLAVDIDFFKRINDRHGHAVGDQALIHLAGLMQSQVRLEDVPIRMGGEEFLVLLPDTGIDAALKLAERLRRAVETKPVAAGDEPLAMTVSLGVAEARPGERLEALLERADQALYRAKEEGRNRVMAASAAD